MNYFPFLVFATLLYVSRSIPPLHLNVSLDLVKRLHNSTNNTYATSPNWIDWMKPATRTQCNSFLNRLHQRTYGTNETYFRQWMNSTSPTAAQWHDTIAAGNRFTQKTRVQDIVEGDFIAIKYPPGLDSTGHAMLVCGNLTAYTNTAPLVLSTAQYYVNVCDSSASYHGRSDTRLSQVSLEGIGMGVFRLYVSASTGEIAGYTWSNLSSSVYYNQSERHLVAGSLKVV